MSASPLLDRIKTPTDLKKIPEKDLPRLAEEIRTELIDTLAETGGHLGPNLGVVELTIALHRVFNTPGDKILFDVSHQGYIHKILTGRRERLGTMRQHGGLNGFLLSVPRASMTAMEPVMRAPLFQPALGWPRRAI